VKTYNVVIEAKVTKELRVEVEENEEVKEVAYEMFDIIVSKPNDGTPEYFTEKILSIEEIKS